MRPRLVRVPLRVRGLAPNGQPLLPVQVRTRLGGNNVPGPNGMPGNLTYPYTESTSWGDGSQGGASPPTTPPQVGTPPPALTPQQIAAESTPFGQSARPWTNPTTYAGFPLVSVSPGLVLTSNDKRNSLIIQNNSSATSPDIAPTLYVGFNLAPSLNNGALALPPGLGFFWGASDCPPRDNIYCVFLGGSGASVVIAGSVIQGTYLDGNAHVPSNPMGTVPWYPPEG